ncbi:ComEC family competence protein [Pedobacter frigiditerrae]|uniref:ComEC family competence protein n=1 Tax=Pedobacter frigiditerrae TaxID=2530452 RepID=A0A4R0MUG3_9SPHI|nr:ComEC/Rec2 family competence protein [Pedobacter frigiditerrae]TCC90453.1 ComEC family competence protein [Pedobacter frigiditerrae]
MTFKSEIVFVRVLFPFIAGIVCTYLFGNGNFIVPSIIANTLLLSYLLSINLFYKKIKAYNFKGINGVLFNVFCFALGGLICLLNTQSSKKKYYADQSYNYLKVWVNAEPQLTNNILHFEVEVAGAYQNNKPTSATGKLLIALKIDSLYPIQLNYGDELIITCKYLPVEPSYNPGEFDFKAWLASKNIYQQTFINQDHIVKLNTIKGNPIIRHAIAERKKQVAIYRQFIKNDEAFAVASTLVLGYRADLSKETLAAYSKTGTIHALSVSGSHIAIIFFLLNSMLSFLDRKKFLMLFKLFFICSLIWYYSLLTGFSSSILRSAIMITIFILAKAFNKNSNNYNILAFTAFALLVYNPFFIWDVGFQLSFISVFGLIYLQPKIYKWIHVQNKWLDKLWSAIALSLAAQLVTFPLSVYYFHQFPMYFILGNLFILLPLIAMMYLGIAILVLRVYFLAPIFEWIITFTNNSLKWIADLPFSRITSIWLNEWQLLLLSLALSLLIYAFSNYHKKLLITSICLLLVFQSYSTYNKMLATKQSKILFFSLRKNYAVAFIDTQKAILLTDLILEDKNYQFFVEPALAKMQVEDILFVKWEQDTIVNSFIKFEKQVKFHQYSILMLDSSFNYKKIAGLPKFDAVWLHQNPKKNISKLRTEVIFSTLLIDASNKDYKIKAYEDEANKFQLQHYTLKKNKAYLINLK